MDVELHGCSEDQWNLEGKLFTPYSTRGPCTIYAQIIFPLVFTIQVYLAYGWCLLGLMLSPPTSPTGPARTVLSVLGYQPQISHRKSPAQEQRPLWSSISILNQYFKPHFECGQDSHADLVWHIANGGDLQYLIDTKHYITFKSQ